MNFQAFFALDRKVAVIKAIAALLERSFDKVPDAHVFVDQALEWDEQAGTRSFTLVVPRLSGMQDLAVHRARIVLRGRAREQTPVEIAKPASTGAQEIALGDAQSDGRRGSLKRVRVDTPRVQPDPKNSFTLDATAGGGRFTWRADAAGKVEFGSRDLGLKNQSLRLLVQPGETRGAYAPPAASAPRFDMPGNQAGMYQAVLGGASLQLDMPQAGALSLELTPPLECRAAKLTLGTTEVDDAKADLPNEVRNVAWSAERIVAVWETPPTDVKVVAVATGDPVTIAEMPGAASERASEFDFTPAAKRMLNDAYQSKAPGDLALRFDIDSSSAGKLDVTDIAIAARYSATPLGGEGASISIRGDPATVELPLAPALNPDKLRLTIDGTFGPGVLIRASDRPTSHTRLGFRVGAAGRVARRMQIGSAELRQPLMRVGLFGRASEPTEILISIQRAKDIAIGAPIGEPAAIVLEPELAPRWRRVELPKSVELPENPAEVWIVVSATRGVFWWYGDADDDGYAQCSADDGRTWTRTSGRPFTQVHVRSEPIEPAPLSVHWNRGLLCSDLLLAVERRGLELFNAQQLAQFAGLDGRLRLSFDCARDAEVHVSDVELLYDPWNAGAI